MYAGNFLGASKALSGCCFAVWKQGAFREYPLTFQFTQLPSHTAIQGCAPAACQPADSYSGALVGRREGLVTDLRGWHFLFLL